MICLSHSFFFSRGDDPQAVCNHINPHRSVANFFPIPLDRDSPAAVYFYELRCGFTGKPFKMILPAQ